MLAFAICASMMCPSGVAQDQGRDNSPAKPPDSSSQAGTSGRSPDLRTPTASSATRADREKEIEKQEQSYRVMGIVPRFGTTHVNAPPLSPTEKLHLFWTSTFDPVTFVLVGGQAGLSQAQDDFDGYSQGAQGYAKRYGAAFTDNATSNFFANFLYPTLFKQDPRYFRLGEGGFRRRLGHSLAEQVMAHQDGGGRMFHFSNVLGALTSGGISNAYYPQDDRGFGLTMSRAGIAMLYGEVGGLFNEFWPDVQNRLMRKKRRHQDPEAAPPTIGSAPQN